MSFFAALMLLVFALSSALLLTEFIPRLSLDLKRNLQVVCAVVFLSLLLMEYILRVNKTNRTYHEIIGLKNYHSYYTGSKNYWNTYTPDDSIWAFRKDFVHKRKTNSLGLTEREINLKDANSVRKFLCLGDSFTEGIGAPIDSTWPRLLESCLNEKLSDSVIVYNAGISGSDPVFQFHLFREKFSDISWDAVIFCLNGTDIEDCIIRGGMERFRPDSTVAYRNTPLWEPLYAASYLFRFAVHNILKYDFYLISPVQKKSLENKAVKDITLALFNASKQLREKESRILVVLHPLKLEADIKTFSNPLMNDLLSELEELKPLNLLPYFSDSLSKDFSSDKIYWKNDNHFNHIGYRLMAEKICREIILRQGVETGAAAE